MNDELNLDDIEAVKSKITQLRQQDKWEEIRNIQLKMLEKNPNNIRPIWDLFLIEMRNGEKKVAKQYIEKILAMKPENSKDLKHFKNILCCVAKVAREDRDFKLLKKIQTLRLELQPRSLWALFDLIAQAKREEDWKRAEKLQLKILEISPDNKQALRCLKEIRSMLDCQDIQDMAEEEFLIQKQISPKQESISEIRTKLYEGEIGHDEILEIAQKYSATTQGTILIAEVCTYLGRQDLAKRFLNAYIKEHQEDMSEKEKKQLKGALQIVCSKQKIKDSVKWAGNYEGQNEGQDDSQIDR